MIEEITLSEAASRYEDVLDDSSYFLMDGAYDPENTERIHAVLGDFFDNRLGVVDTVFTLSVLSEFSRGNISVCNDYLAKKYPYGGPDPGSVKRGKPTYEHSQWRVNDLTPQLFRITQARPICVDWSKIIEDRDERSGKSEKEKLYRLTNTYTRETDRGRDAQFGL